MLGFWRAAASATHRLTAEEYFSPYLTNLLAVLNGKGLNLYNEKVEPLTTPQVVVDDILAQQEAQKSRPPERRKSYESLRHDVALWHFVSQKRSASVDSPLDAAFWVVTVDYRLIRFDKHKTRQRGAASVPICVHPAALIQMLQLWLPRTAQFDAAMLQCVRALLPRPTDTDVETVTLRILRTLSRFEDVDDLPEETVASVLLSRALRARMETANAADKQTALVREALVVELAVAEGKLSEEKNVRSAVEGELSEERNVRSAVEGELSEERNVRSAVEDDLRAAQSRAAELEQKARKGQTSLQAVQLELQREQESRQKLEARFVRFEERLHRGSFLVVAILLLGLFGAVMRPGARMMGDLIGHQGLGTMMLMAMMLLALWTLVVDQIGQRIGAISTWGPFNLFHRAKTWLFGVLGVIAAGLLTNFLWEYWQTGV